MLKSLLKKKPATHIPEELGTLRDLLCKQYPELSAEILPEADPIPEAEGWQRNTALTLAHPSAPGAFTELVCVQRQAWSADPKSPVYRTAGWAITSTTVAGEATRCYLPVEHQLRETPCRQTVTAAAEEAARYLAAGDARDAETLLSTASESIDGAPSPARPE